MPMRRLLAFLLTGWTAALPAHVPVLVCFCTHEADEPCQHGSEERPTKHEHAPALPESGIGGTAPAPDNCRCYEFKSSYGLVPAAVSWDRGGHEAAAEPPAAPVVVEAAARPAPPAIPRAAGPPIYLRLLALLV
jgi:hypothetical protein